MLISDAINAVLTEQNAYKEHQMIIDISMNIHVINGKRNNVDDL